ncbi:hypothetical protein FHW03_001572 [Ochrobactrum sp. RH2CCR150]|nr:hypothetical protein [Ochrobactrum sp. RH2CCR150]
MPLYRAVKKVSGMGAPPLGDVRRSPFSGEPFQIQAFALRFFSSFGRKTVKRPSNGRYEQIV